MILYEFFLYIALFAGTFPFLFLFLKKRAFIFKEPIIPFIWLTFLATLYEGEVLLSSKINFSYWFQIYSLVEFLTIFYFYFYLFQPQFKVMFRMMFVFLIINYGISFYCWEEYSVFTAKAVNKIPLTFLVLLGSFWWVRNLFKSVEIQNLWRNPNFYFVAGFYIYYLVTMPLFLMSNFIFDSGLYFYDFAIINVMATLILRILLTIGVWKMN